MESLTQRRKGFRSSLRPWRVHRVHSLGRETGKENEIARIFVEAAYKIRMIVGPALLESAYLAMMVHELKQRGVEVWDEHPVPLAEEGHLLDPVAYRADLIVGRKVIVEFKSVEKVAPRP